MIPTSTEPPKENLQINQDTKFFNKLLSKETSMANPSFRVYYGVATGAVPFLWESQPGTPKNSIHTPSLPPLTPPPSYHSKLQTKKSNHSKKHSSKYNTLISSILPRLSLRKSHASSSPSPSLSSSSLSFSSSSLSPSRSHRSRSSSLDNDDDSVDGSPAVTGRLRGCYSMVLMKNALLSIVGYGSSQSISTA
ncbi:uncharacterized protein LOC120264590 [Dioscorea cayenensis subsp. rotundata]|uniref:Uncharacterized protein LOC120264590 n=1 Tax=Dioscorea cayennensis subsp. rotundata TaxID=55577 RepID=A0AB40BLW1_DIOCR|nr:uncharacterized protein LOC120264590 [Dioscorea cayenensis subsp. rotundata]